MRKLGLLIVALASWAVVSPASARAPDTFEEEYAEPVNVDSPMWFALELKVGPYRPGRTDLFQKTFLNDRGWMLNIEVDATLVHIPWVGQFNLGFNWGWSSYDARAFNADLTERIGDTEFTVFPMAALGVLRIDTLARKTVVPLTFAGKLGYELVRWKAKSEGEREGDGLNKGLRWGLQAALELDFFDRNTARRTDEDWGINHTSLLFEWYESRTKGTGDSTFSVGLGAQF
jgi:hypothetical protein